MNHPLYDIRFLIFSLSRKFWWCDHSVRWFMANHDIPNRRARWNELTETLEQFSHVGWRTTALHNGHRDCVLFSERKIPAFTPEWKWQHMRPCMDRSLVLMLTQHLYQSKSWTLCRRRSSLQRHITSQTQRTKSVEEQEEPSTVINCISCGKRYIGSNVWKCVRTHVTLILRVLWRIKILMSRCYVPSPVNHSIHTEQMKFNIEQQRQAPQKIFDSSLRRFQWGKLGDTVMFPVSLVETFELGTKHGLLKQVYIRN